MVSFFSILLSRRTVSSILFGDVVALQDKLAHVRALTNILLPNGNKLGLMKPAEHLLDDDEGQARDPVSLLNIRKQSIEAGEHEFAWQADIHSCPISFSVGDVGYISHEQGRATLTDKTRFDRFVKVGNIFDDTLLQNTKLNQKLSIIREVSGSLGQWTNGFHRSDEIWPFPLPEDIEGSVFTLVLSLILFLIYLQMANIDVLRGDDGSSCTSFRPYVIRQRGVAHPITRSKAAGGECRGRATRASLECVFTICMILTSEMLL